MTTLLNKVEKYINSDETLRFAVGIEMPKVEPIAEPFMKRKNDEERLERNDKKPQNDMSLESPSSYHLSTTTIHH